MQVISIYSELRNQGPVKPGGGGLHCFDFVNEFQFSNLTLDEAPFENNHH